MDTPNRIARGARQGDHKARGRDPVAQDGQTTGAVAAAPGASHSGAPGGPAPGAAVAIQPGMLAATAPTAVAALPAGRHPKRPRDDQAPAAGHGLVARHTSVPARGTSLLEVVQQHFARAESSSSSSSSSTDVGGGKRSRQRGALDGEIRDWLRDGKALIAVPRLRDGLGNLLGSLHTLTPSRQQAVIDALGPVIGQNGAHRSVLGDVLLDQERLGDDQVVECVRMFTRALDTGFSDFLKARVCPEHGGLLDVLASRGSRMLAAMREAQVGLEDLFLRAVATGSAGFIGQLATLEGGARMPPAQLERWIRLVVDSPTVSKLGCIEAIGWGVATPTMSAEHAAVFERLSREPLGTDAFQTRTWLLFVAMHPHAMPAQIGAWAVAEALRLEEADGRRLMRGMTLWRDPFRRFGLLPELLDELLLLVQRDAARGRPLLEAVLDDRSLPELALYAHRPALAPAAALVLGQACAAVRPPYVHPAPPAPGLLAALAGGPPWLPEAHACLQTLVDGYASALMERPDGRSHWYQAVRELTARPMAPIDRAPMFQGLGTAARPVPILRQVLPLLLRVMEKRPALGWGPLIDAFMKGLNATGLPEDAAQALGEALDHLAHGAAPGSPAMALLAGAERMLDPALVDVLMRAARPRDLPVRDGKAWTRPAAADAGDSVVRARALLEQARQLPSAMEHPALPEIAPGLQEAARLWLAVQSEQRRLPRADHHARERAEALQALEKSMEILASMATADPIPLAEARQAFRQFMATPGARTDVAWLEDTVAFGWRVGLPRMRVADATQLMVDRIVRLHGFTPRKDVDGTERDPVLAGMLQLAGTVRDSLAPHVPLLASHLGPLMLLRARGVTAAHRGDEDWKQRQRILQGWIMGAANAAAVNARDLIPDALAFLVRPSAPLAATEGVRMLAKVLAVQDSPELTQDLVEALANSLPRGDERLAQCITSLVTFLSGSAGDVPRPLEAVVRAALRCEPPACLAILESALAPLNDRPALRMAVVLGAIRPEPAATQVLLMRQRLYVGAESPIHAFWHDLHHFLRIAPAQGRVLSGLPDADRAWLQVADALALRRDEVLLLPYAHRHMRTRLHALGKSDDFLETGQSAVAELSRQGPAQARTWYGQAIATFDAGPALVLRQAGLSEVSRLNLYAGMLPCSEPLTPTFVREALMDLQARAPTPDLLLGGMLKLATLATQHLGREDFRSMRIWGLDAIRRIELDAPPARRGISDSKRAPVPAAAVDPEQAHTERMVTASANLTGLYQHLARRPELAFVYRPAAHAGAAGAQASAAQVLAKKDELLAEREFVVQELVQMTRPEHPADIRERTLALITQFLGSLDEALAPVLGGEETPGGLHPADAVH